MPDVTACHSCRAQSGDFFFDIMGGVIECAECRRLAYETRSEPLDPHERHVVAILSESAKAALAYCIYAPIERIFSFNIADDDMRFFVRAAEEYLLNQLGRSYRSLDFYKDIKR